VTQVADTDLTLQEAAERLGVHYMTAYRYVRLGVLPARKVAGSWRIAAADVARVNEQGVRAHPAPVGAAPTSASSGARRRAPWSERLEARLVAGDGAGSWSVVETAMAGGSTIDEIYLDVIAPAMRRIGQRWADGELDISVEHRATGITFRLMGRLGPRLARRGRTRGAVVVGAPEGERHSLPTAMLADLVRSDGWDVSDVGADLPTESFLRSVLDTPDVVAVGVSVTLDEHLPAATELLAALRAGLPHVVLAVGGGAIGSAEQAAAMGAEWVESPAAFRALLNTLDQRGATVAID
jgi:excisionase family DNA binding protein